jgi:hypothetical protein
MVVGVDDVALGIENLDEACIAARVLAYAVEELDDGARDAAAGCLSNTISMP